MDRLQLILKNDILIRIFLTFAFLLSIQLFVLGQTKTCKIEGEFKNGISTGFVYLTDPTKQSVQVEPIVLGKFVFHIKKEKDFQGANLFISEDSLKNHEFFKSNRREIDSRLIAVEDAKIIVSTSVKQAIVLGTKYNEQLDLMNKVALDGNHSYFFEKYPDSPVALIFLNTLARLNNVPGLIPVDCNFLFSKLSKRLQHSEEGKAFYTKMNKN